MSVLLKIKPGNCCEYCGNVYSFTIGLYDDEQAALRRLKPGDHPRAFDGYCGSCSGPLKLRCTVQVKADGKPAIVMER